ncbi:MAG: TOBE domain-containing protein [Arcobacteraceae bacterium]|jgi:molybdopterin-binding protein|nr:TOBE domain-containing protein [Arcobacteraceae bacterium]
MNILQGKISDIKTCDEIAQVSVDVGGIVFSSILIDADSMNLKIHDNVDILFKETEVLVATKQSSVSARNAFLGGVMEIKQGEILSEISFSFQKSIIKSIITTGSLKALNIKKGDEFLWFVKANEVTLRLREL